MLNIGIFNWLNIVSFLVGLAGLCYAVYQAREKRKLEEFTRSQSWYIYSMANNVTGIAQASLRAYQEEHAQNQNVKVVELMAKTTAFGQDMFRETIRQIQLSEPEFTSKQITDWVEDGKIDKDHSDLFKIICVKKLALKKLVP